MGAEAPDSLKQVSDVDERVRLTEDVLPVCDELAKLLALSKVQSDAQHPAFKQRTKAQRPLAGLLVPAGDQLLAQEQRRQARMAMLLAGLAMIEDDPDKLKAIQDSFGDGPFEHRTLDKGFELKSKLLYEGQSVTLTIGQRAND